MRDKYDHRNNRNSNIWVFIKGAVIGGTMLVPGVSGGTMAMILNIYDKLISSVSSFMKDKRNSLLFLVIFAAGAGAGMILFSKPLLHLIETHTMPTLYFFMGAVVGGIPLILKQAGTKRFSIRDVFYIFIGITIVFAVSHVPADKMGAAAGDGIHGIVFLMAAGLFIAIGLVLPGISVSYLLLIIGLYDETMMAISRLYMPYLIPLAVGLGAGIIVTTKMIEKALTIYPHPTYTMILGFVFGSVTEVFPGMPHGALLPLSIAAFFAGAFLIMLLTRSETTRTL